MGNLAGQQASSSGKPQGPKPAPSPRPSDSERGLPSQRTVFFVFLNLPNTAARRKAGKARDRRAFHLAAWREVFRVGPNNARLNRVLGRFLKKLQDHEFQQLDNDVFHYFLEKSVYMQLPFSGKRQPDRVRIKVGGKYVDGSLHLENSAIGLTESYQTALDNASVATTDLLRNRLELILKYVRTAELTDSEEHQRLLSLSAGVVEKLQLVGDVGMQELWGDPLDARFIQSRTVPFSVKAALRQLEMLNRKLDRLIEEEQILDRGIEDNQAVLRESILKLKGLAGAYKLYAEIQNIKDKDPQAGWILSRGRDADLMEEILHFAKPHYVTGGYKPLYVLKAQVEELEQQLTALLKRLNIGSIAAFEQRIEQFETSFESAFRADANVLLNEAIRNIQVSIKKQEIDRTYFEQLYERLGPIVEELKAKATSKGTKLDLSQAMMAESSQLAKEYPVFRYKPTNELVFKLYRQYVSGEERGVPKRGFASELKVDLYRLWLWRVRKIRKEFNSPDTKYKLWNATKLRDQVLRQFKLGSDETEFYRLIIRRRARKAKEAGESLMNILDVVALILSFVPGPGWLVAGARAIALGLEVVTLSDATDQVVEGKVLHDMDLASTNPSWWTLGLRAAFAGFSKGDLIRALRHSDDKVAKLLLSGQRETLERNIALRKLGVTVEELQKSVLKGEANRLWKNLGETGKAGLRAPGAMEGLTGAAVHGIPALVKSAKLLVSLGRNSTEQIVNQLMITFRKLAPQEDVVRRIVKDAEDEFLEPAKKVDFADLRNAVRRDKREARKLANAEKKVAAAQKKVRDLVRSDPTATKKINRFADRAQSLQRARDEALAAHTITRQIIERSKARLEVLVYRRLKVEEFLETRVPRGGPPSMEAIDNFRVRNEIKKELRHLNDSIETIRAGLRGEPKRAVKRKYWHETNVTAHLKDSGRFLSVESQVYVIVDLGNGKPFLQVIDDLAEIQSGIYRVTDAKYKASLWTESMLRDSVVRGTFTTANQKQFFEALARGDEIKVTRLHGGAAIELEAGVWIYANMKDGSIGEMLYTIQKKSSGKK